MLDQLPAACREMIIRTSVSAEVPAGLSRAIMGEDVAGPSAWVDEAQGFLEPGADGSWRCHPLLRRAARRRLDRDWPSLVPGGAASRSPLEHRSRRPLVRPRPGRRPGGLGLGGHGARAIAGRAECSARGGGSGHGRDCRSGRARRHRAPDRRPPRRSPPANRRSRRPPLLSSARCPRGPTPSARAHRLTEAIVAMAIARARIDVEDGLQLGP